jgi:hypothetical protein
MPELRDHAIVVGIGHYGDGLKPLAGPLNDACCFRDWLISPTGGDLPPENVNLILSEAGPSGRVPTRQKIEDAIHAHFRGFKRPGPLQGQRQRRIYLYVSGHGIEALDFDEERCLLLMADAAIDSLARNAPILRAADLFRRTSVFEEVVVFADCCRENAQVKDIAQPYSFEHSLTELLKAANGTKVPCVYGLATQWSALAYELDLPGPGGNNVRRSAFTYALLEGLQQAVDGTGNITKEKLEAYVTTRVEGMPLGDVQTPIIRFDGDIVLRKVARSSSKTTVRVTLAKPDQGFQVRHGSTMDGSLTVPRVEVKPGVFEVALDPGMYFFATPGVGDAFSSSRLEDVIGVNVVDVAL